MGLRDASRSMNDSRGRSRRAGSPTSPRIGVSYSPRLGLDGSDLESPRSPHSLVTPTAHSVSAIASGSAHATSQGSMQQTKPKSQQRRKGTAEAASRPDVDLGFRPDGGGEDSLENWSLFKVSKSTEMTSTQMGASLGFSMNSSSSSFAKDRDRQMSATETRWKSFQSGQNFQTYMVQMQNGQGAKDMSKSTSAPNLEKLAHKKGPGLPQLIKKKNTPGSDPMAVTEGMVHGDRS